MHDTSCLLLLAALAAAVPAGGCAGRGAPPPVLRIGHFANVTHAHALVAHDSSRAGGGSGWFESRVGLPVEWFVYNAGPSAMEALLAGSIDVAYVGPAPAVQAHVRTGGRDIRVIAGATLGGAALVVRKDSGLRVAADFRGRRIATPQLGNTQDVACRAWLLAHGLRVTQTGGDVLVVPTHNPDQLALLSRGDVDAVWTVEPWVTRLVREAGGEVLVDERDAVTTVVVASARFLAERPGLARAFLDAHAELTDWLAANPAEAMRRVQAELERETRRPLSADLLAQSWSRLRFTSRVDAAPFASFAAAARRLGFLRAKTGVEALVFELPAAGEVRR